MGIGSARKGTWWLGSEKDPRWNRSGKTLIAGLKMPKECEQTLEEMKSLLGEPPDDLEYGYMKD